MSADTVLALVGLALTLLVTQAGAIVWVVSYVERAIRGERDNADRVYARAVQVALVEARLGVLEQKLDGIGTSLGSISNILERMNRKLSGHHDHEGEGK